MKVALIVSFCLTLLFLGIATVRDERAKTGEEHMSAALWVIPGFLSGVVFLLLLLYTLGKAFWGLL